MIGSFQRKAASQEAKPGGIVLRGKTIAKGPVRDNAGWKVLAQQKNHPPTNRGVVLEAISKQIAGFPERTGVTDPGYRF
jgi:hypothetical protein